MNCPKCNAIDSMAQIDVITGYAMFWDISPDGEIAWSGDTQVDWNSQRPKHKNPRYICTDCSEEFTLKQMLKHRNKEGAPA